MLQLSDRQWEEFFIGGKQGIFNITTTSSGIDKKYLIDDGKASIPYITRTDVNNGINLFISEKQNKSYKADKENVITIGLDTQTVFYQTHSFFTGQNIQVLRHKSMNKFNALFIIPLIKKQIKKFNWGGNGATLGRLSRTRILLPVDSSNNPDFKFMEIYVREHEEKKKQEYIAYVKKIIEKLEYKRILPLSEKEWRPVFIGGTDGIFTISSGKRLIKSDMISGGIPFIGATDNNNGITNWVSTANSTLDSNVLGVNYNGSVVENFYHPYKCIFTDDVKRLHMRNTNDNRFVLLFIKVAILKQKRKYTYGYKFNANRMSRQKILLPTNDSGEPDYMYMEQYIKNLMLEKYTAYLKYQNT